MTSECQGSVPTHPPNLRQARILTIRYYKIHVNQTRGDGPEERLEERTSIVPTDCLHLSTLNPKLRITHDVSFLLLLTTN